MNEFFCTVLRNNFTLKSRTICELLNVLQGHIFCIKSIIVWTFEAQTFYSFKYANERSENYTNAERYIFEIVVKLFGRQILIRYCININLKYLSCSP